MKSYPYRKVDAFTSKTSRGNPAAYLITGKNTLSSEEMLSIGKEHKGFVSEVVFCALSDIADVKLTYYSSKCEVDFCGHGTIAAMYDYIKNNKELRGKRKITADTNKMGKLTVYNHLDDNDSIYITAPKAQWLPNANFTSRSRRRSWYTTLSIFERARFRYDQCRATNAYYSD